MTNTEHHIPAPSMSRHMSAHSVRYPQAVCINYLNHDDDWQT